MVGAAHHEDAIVAFKAVNLIQEVTAHLVGDDGIEVLKHQIAGCQAASQRKDLLKRSLGAGVLLPS